MTAIMNNEHATKLKVDCVKLGDGKLTNAT